MKEEFKTYHQRIVETRRDGKLWGYFGKIFPKTAEEIINECSREVK